MATAVDIFYSAQKWEGQQQNALNLGGTQVPRMHQRINWLQELIVIFLHLNVVAFIIPMHRLSSFYVFF